MKRNNLSSILFLIFTLLLIMGFTSYAQKDLDEKISNIGSDIEKITIIAGGNEYTFEGKDAEKLFKRFKAHKKMKSYVFEVEKDSDGESDDIIIKSFGDDDCHVFSGNGKKHIIWLGEDSDSGMNKIKIYSGSDEETIMMFDEDKDSEFEWFGESKNGMSKKLKVEIDNGVKKVTVTTIEDGEEKTEVYEGDEADKYLEEMKSESGDDMHFEMFGDDDGKKLNKIYIKKKVHKDKSE